MSKIPLAALLPHEITKALNLAQEFRGKQIFKWIQKGTIDWNEMTDLPGSLKPEFASKADPRTSVMESLTGEKDISYKIRIKLFDGLYIESVLLVDDQERKTACLSSQVGCSMGCVFCKTGTMGCIRNLGAHEIVEQFHILVSRFGEISHIVFMGMGEPLLNLDEVRKAIAVFHHPLGKNISLRKMTISTCGIIRGIKDLALHGPHPRLAVSLITADEETRKRLMPCSAANSLEELKGALSLYQKETKKWITLEIVLLKGVTDREEDIRKLINFIPPLRASVNIIPWNPAPGLPFKRPESLRIQWFRSRLTEAGLVVTQRYQKGNSIDAACGQLFVTE
ncbi:MAG: 23S rRNA (adenine(2503)-C(2))-methyltransferase RlmN [Spirochaetales bacterium]|nr:23S rRNA (adenine(2503)-C(2))-methyltransferase RlmN [Spirochaetales bacterium]